MSIVLRLLEAALTLGQDVNSEVRRKPVQQDAREYVPGYTQKILMWTMVASLNSCGTGMLSQILLNSFTRLFVRFIPPYF